MIHWRTTTRPDGTSETREHVWGLDVILPALAIMGGITAAWISNVKDQTSTAKEVAMLREQLPAIVAATVTRVDKEAGYVTREEWASRGDQQDQALRDALAPINRQLDAIISAQMHGLRLIEKLPAQPVKEKKR